MNRDSNDRNFELGLGPRFGAALFLASGFVILVSALLAAQVYTVTGPGGVTGTITVATQPAAALTASSQPTTVASSQPTVPVASSQPATQPSIQPTQYAQVISSVFETLDAAGLPVPKWISQPLINGVWIASIPKDAAGNLNLDFAVTAAKNAGKCVYISNPGPLRQAGDYSDLASAVAQNPLAIGYRAGDNYGTPVEDQNIEMAAGTAASPIIVFGAGANGLTNHALARPKVQGGFGLDDGRTGHPASHWIYVTGLELAGTNSGQPYAIGFSDSGSGTASDHLLVDDCNIHGFMTAINLTNNNWQTVLDTNALIYRTAIHNNFVAFYGMWDGGFIGVSKVDSVIADNGWDVKLAPKNGDVRLQGEYVAVTNPVYANAIDPQHQDIDDIYAANASSGAQCNQGGVVDSCLFLANPIGLVIGGGYQCGVNNCVFDGDNAEFDAISSWQTTNSSGQAVTTTGGAGAALGMGAVGFPPSNTGLEYGMGVKFDCASGDSYLVDCLFIDKPDNVNSNPAIQVNCVDQEKTPPLPTPNPPVRLHLIGNIVHNWRQWPIASASAASGGPNVLGVSVTDGGVTSGPPTLIYTDGAVNYFDNVSGIAGVNGTPPAWVDPTRCVSTYAKSLGIAGVVDGPSFLAAAENNWSGNWNPQLTAAAAIQWIREGYTVK